MARHSHHYHPLCKILAWTDPAFLPSPFHLHSSMTLKTPCPSHQRLPTRSRAKSKCNTAPIGQTTVPMAPKPSKHTGANIGTHRSENETAATILSVQVTTTVEAWQELVGTIVLPMNVPALGMVVNIPPLTQPHPDSSSAPSPCASERIPIQSKRNAVANAIGTNLSRCIGSVSNIQDMPSTKQKMKRAEETMEGTAKKSV